MYREFDIRIANPTRRKVAKKVAKTSSRPLSMAQIRAMLNNPTGTQLFKSPEFKALAKGTRGRGKSNMGVKAALARATGGEYFDAKHNYSDDQYARFMAALADLLPEFKQSRKAGETDAEKLERLATRKLLRQRMGLKKVSPEVAALLQAQGLDLGSLGLAAVKKRAPRKAKA